MRIRLDRLDERQWDAVLATLASRSGHIAQLSSGTLPRELDDDLAAVDVSLIPSMFDADATCTCEEWDVPCRHAVALLFFLLRGREVQEILQRRHGALPCPDRFRRRRAPAEAPCGRGGSTTLPPEVRADAVWSAIVTAISRYGDRV